MYLAGVLAAMWPCGIITSLNELYCSESKSLVYGYLHDFYNEFPDIGSNIRECNHAFSITKCSTAIFKFGRSHRILFAHFLSLLHSKEMSHSLA